MRLAPLRIEAGGDGTTWSAALAAGSVGVGPVEVTIGVDGDWSVLSWTVANRSGRPLPIRSVALVFGLADVSGPLRVFRHGYQSWSSSGVATFGSDVDPSTRARFEFLQAVHHADQHEVHAPDELRSEWVTVLADISGDRLLVGFEAGSTHDGTLRLRSSGEGSGIELVAEAFLGDAVFGAGEQRPLHGIVVDASRDASASELLERWACATGQAGGARVGAPFQVGWCSWYQYFDAVSEISFLGNLARAQSWPFDVFQLDDGYQSAVGDWLTTRESFPSGLAAVSETVASAGLRPGLWLAPFLAAPDSQVATRHPDWLARRVGAQGSAHPLYAWWNPAWGGGRDGFMYALDTTNPEVLAHLEATARTLVEMGFSYLKLDFTFAPSVDGVWFDPSRTPAQRVRAGFEAIRRGAGEDTFLLGCGVPLSHVVGVVDGNRIGPDVAPTWALDPSAEIVPGYLDIQPATQHAYAAAVTRSFMHRRLWLNDPDCLMLRSSDTSLSPEAAVTWARTVGLSGGMAFDSDDLSLLGNQARALLSQTLETGRASDAAAVSGLPALTPDLMDRRVPETFTAIGASLITDPDTGSSTLTSGGG